MTSLTLLGKDLGDGGCDPSPVLLFLRKLFAAGGSECVDFGTPPGVQFLPGALDESFFRQTVKRGKERAGSNLEGAFSHLLNAVGDADAVERSQFESTEDEEVQSALQEVGRSGHMLR